MFAKISVMCFAATYVVTLALELSRLYFGVNRKLIITTLITAVIGIFAHTVFLVEQARTGILDHTAPLSSWFHWYLIAAWAIVVVYLVLAYRRAGTALGLFLLPITLVLIGIATRFLDGETGKPTEILPAAEASRIWGTIHGITLLMGTVAVLIGFVSGVMYLLHSHRLKNKLPPKRGFRLPSLEWLHSTSESSLVISSFLLGAGVLSGVGLNLARSAGDVALPWTDPVVWTSGILFLWLVSACLFLTFYKPARVGRKMAYLTVASFVFLALVLMMVMFGPTSHGSPNVTAANPTTEVPS